MKQQFPESRNRRRFSLAVPLLTLAAFITLVWAFQSCKDNGGGGLGSAESGDSTCKSTTFVPVELSDSGIPNFHFPEDSFALKRWAADPAKFDSMYAHAWGIWAGMTNPSGECYDGQPLLVFETWLTPQDVMASEGRATLLAASSRNPRPLGKLSQFGHGNPNAGGTHGEETVLGFVKYNPAAAQHIHDKQLLKKSTLDSMQKAGVTQVPVFPDMSISIKPVFQAISKADLEAGGGYYQMNVWNGPPATDIAYPQQNWPNCVWVDMNNKSNGTASSPCGAGRTASNTFNLTDFIHFKMTAAEAKAQSGGGETYAAGDYAILLACHITSREFSNWTWESTYWDPSPSDPQVPCSPAILAAKPANLNGAAAHYSIAVAFSMVFPPIPVSPTDFGTPVIAFNPYLEAGFNDTILPFSKPWISAGTTYDYKVGVKSNCMSCHAGATYPVQRDANNSRVLYTADQFIDLDGPQYNGILKTDFLWSLGSQAK